MKQDTRSGSIVIIIGIIQIALIMLRIFEIIRWPWAVVLLPVLIPAGFAALILIVAVIAAIVKEIFRRM